MIFVIVLLFLIPLAMMAYLFIRFYGEVPPTLKAVRATATTLKLTIQSSKDIAPAFQSLPGKIQQEISNANQIAATTTDTVYRLKEAIHAIKPLAQSATMIKTRMQQVSEKELFEKISDTLSNWKHKLTRKKKTRQLARRSVPFLIGGVTAAGIAFIARTVGFRRRLTL